MNGRLVPEAEAKISVYDSALMSGDMVFEMTRSFGKRQFKLREHLERLYAGLKILRIPVGMDLAAMERHCQETIDANEPLFGADGEHRLMLARGRRRHGVGRAYPTSLQDKMRMG
ncbi:MAG: aminotransferase class IV [Betaproteobacteria bacterium]|nr:aminotransferase class IV [Betaproteobacteria bacterium]